jgi:ribose transport system permease protein
MNLFPRLLRTEWAGLAAIFVAGLVAASFVSPSFLTEYNIYVLLRSACVSLLVAFAQMIVLAVGQMNLAVGALGGLVAVLFGALLQLYGVPPIVAIPLAMLIGITGGLLNGFLTTRTGINGFIITLASGSAFTGINLGITEGKPFHDIPADLVAFGDSRWSFFPALLWPPLIVAPLLWVFLYRMKSGRRLLATGGNLHAAELSGIPTGTMVVLAHAISGGLAGLAAVLAVSQLGTAQPDIGNGWLLVSFAGPIIGGTALAGGYVSIPGAMLAVLIIALIQNGLVLAKVDPYWVQFALGVLVLMTVGLNRWRAVRAAKAA